MDRFSDIKAPALSIAMKDVKRKYLSEIRNLHIKNPEYFSVTENNDIISVINNNLDEWEEKCVKPAFNNCNILKNEEIEVSYTAWIICGFEMVVKEVSSLSSAYYLDKITDT